MKNRTMLGIGLLMLAETVKRKVKEGAIALLVLGVILSSMGAPQLAAAATVSKTFTTHSTASDVLLVYGGESFTYDVSGTFVGTVKLQRSRNGSSWENFLVISSSFSTTPALTGTIQVETARGVRQFFRVYASTHSEGSIVTSIADANDLVEEKPNLKGVAAFKLYDDGVVIPGTLDVTGAASVGGALSVTGAVSQAAVGTSVGLRLTPLNASTSGYTVSAVASQTADLVAVSSPSATTPTMRVTSGGQFLPKRLTKALIDLEVPAAVGAVIICTDCTIPYSLCTGTGTAAAQWARAGSSTVGCGTNN